MTVRVDVNGTPQEEGLAGDLCSAFFVSGAVMFKESHQQKTCTQVPLSPKLGAL